MRARLLLVAIITVVTASAVQSRCTAQQATTVAVTTVRPVTEPETAPAPAKKFHFIFFWKDNDPATQDAANALKASLEKRADRAESSIVNITDAANQAIVNQYQVSRAPMPLVLCIAPNGAITGSMMRQQVGDEAVERLLVTPAMADVTKALQDKQIAVVHIAADARTPLPPGAATFVADPMFQNRTRTVALVADDKAEARFLKDLQINPSDLRGSLVVVFAPPGVVVGKFPAEATVEQYATALHAAGKCCNDPNCKYNQKGK